MRALTIALRGLAAVLGLSVLCIVLALVFFNPNRQRERISAWVDAQTGQHLTVNGEFDWQLWPYPGLTLPAMSLGPAQQASLPALLSWRSGQLSLQFWPLFKGHIVFGELRLDGLRVKLRRDAQGRDNWRELLDRLPADNAPSRWQLESIAALQLNDAELSWRDEMTDSAATLQLTRLQMGALRWQQPVTLSLQGRVTARQAAREIDWPLSLQVRAQMDAGLQHLELQTLTSEGWLSAPGVTRLPYTLVMSGQWHAPPGAISRLELSGLNLQTGSAVSGRATLTGAVQVSLQPSQAQTQTQVQPRIQAQLQFSTAQLRQWLLSLGVSVPATRDVSVLQELVFTLSGVGTTQDMHVAIPQLQLDETRMQGALQLQRATVGQATPHYALQLQADQLNLDRYLPQSTPGRSVMPTTTTPLPILWLRQLQVQGTLQIDQAQWQGIRARGLLLELSSS